MNNWVLIKQRGFSNVVKERLLRKNEVMIKDGVHVEFLWFLIEGKLSVEKEVEVKEWN